MNERRFADQVFELLISQIVERLQHQDLEHQHGIVGLAAGVALPRLGRQPDHRLDLAPEALERHGGVDHLERITLGTDCIKPLVEIVKAHLPHGTPRLAHHAAPPNPIC